jgi:hypothetical protein
MPEGNRISQIVARTKSEPPTIKRTRTRTTQLDHFNFVSPPQTTMKAMQWSILLLFILEASAFPMLMLKSTSRRHTELFVSEFRHHHDDDTDHQIDRRRFLVSGLLSGLLAMTLTPPVQASPMICASQNCQTQLTRCMNDKTCATGLACLLGCQLHRNSNADEGNCQVRCMDLYENEAMQALTDCALTDHQCYPPSEADAKYPVISKDLAMKDFDLRQFDGSWWVAAGWNPTFDCFPCAKHNFFYMDEELVEATFSYRIIRDDGTIFTRSGDKTLTPTANGGQLELRLRPDRMDYVDDWTILAFEPNEYIVVYYHGGNVAWKGYGGLNVYTRCVLLLLADLLFRMLSDCSYFWALLLLFRSGRLPENPEVQKAIDKGLAKVGLSLGDLTIVDNTCSAT